VVKPLPRLRLQGFNNLTKALSFNIYDVCYARTEEERQRYIEYIDEEYNADRLTQILTDVAEIIGANILNIARQDYDPQGASVTILISEQPVVDKADAKGVVVSQVMPASQSYSLVKEATLLAKAQGMDELSPAMLEGFASAKVLVEALRRAGPRPSRASLHNALENLGRVDLGGLVLDYSPTDHTGLDFVDLSIISAGGKRLRPIITILAGKLSHYVKAIVVEVL